MLLNQTKQAAIQNGQYIPANTFPIDVDVDYKGPLNSRIFITIPRFNVGVPITLGYVSNLRNNDGLLISAYPNYQWQSSHGRNCDDITSVFRIAVSF